MLTCKILFLHEECIDIQVFGIEVLITEKNEKTTKIQGHFPPDLGEFRDPHGSQFWILVDPDGGSWYIYNVDPSGGSWWMPVVNIG